MGDTAMPFYYLSLQYSAIQKTVLRHDRLWSMAGISLQLACLNEITFKQIAENEENGGTVMVAGGGKFTARFPTREQAERAKSKIVQILATTLPMTEFQVSEILPAASFSDIKFDQKDDKGNVISTGILSMLTNQKNSFRGYGVSFNPHLAGCAECGEYPAISDLFVEPKGGHNKPDPEPVCRVCHSAKLHARFSENGDTDDDLVIILRDKNPAELTTLERIYSRYLAKTPNATGKLAFDFDNLFPQGKRIKGGESNETGGQRQRMAVWCSDLNNMNQKVPIWLGQDEKEILQTFDKVKDVNIDIIATALSETFPSPESNSSYLSFRIIVAGGDDLCIVMPEKYIISFALNLSKALDVTLSELEKKGDNPLSTAWLEAGRDKVQQPEPPGPYSFGGSFVVASLHTPFRKIHQLCEDLMGKAKKQSRGGNSVNWRIMAEAESLTDRLLKFEKPLFIDEPDPKALDSDKYKQEFTVIDKLSFEKYAKLASKYGGISSSHIQEIVGRMIELKGDPNELDNSLKRYDSAGLEKSFSKILTDQNFRDSNGKLLPNRLATLFELMSIARQPIVKTETSDRSSQRG